MQIKVQDLKPGMGILGITGLSSEYSYLDSRRIIFLKEQFGGTKVTVIRNDVGAKVPVETLNPGDEITAITDFPPGMAFDAIDDEMTELLKEKGFLEFHVKPFQKEAPPEQPSPKEAIQEKKPPKIISRNIPTFASSGGLEHKKKVAEVRYFFEQVEEAENERNGSSEILRELFQQGRANKHTTQPALEAVERILQKNISGAMSAVTGLRSSDQTYTHCVDVAVIFNEAAQGIIKRTGQSVSDKISRSTLTAGFMHDIGKSKVPQDILDSTERFALDSKEMEIMRSHVIHSEKILSEAGMDDAMINIAKFHHVKKNTSLPTSYPQADFNEVNPLTKLAAIIDVYQALTGKRSYKKNFVPGEAVKMLLKQRGNEYDEVMMDNFCRFIGTYPVGSLVRLSTGDLAFVTKVEGQELERPVVVITENAQGEFLSSNPLVDLMAEKDISITELLDHYEYYNESSEQPFQVFKSLRAV